MLTYLPPDQRAAPATYERPWLLLLLAFAWLWPGVFAHDLWQGEIPVYAVIAEAGSSGQWWLPEADGSAYWDISPLYVWLSLLFLRLFDGLNPYEAVRIVNAALAAVSIAAMGGAGRILLGRRNGRTVALIFIGCPGLLMMSHFIDTDIITLCGLSLSFYALALARQKTVKAIALILCGWLVLSLSGSLLPLLGVMAVTLLLAGLPEWRNKRFILTGLAAAGLAVPLLFVWPLLLQQLSPDGFELWWQQHALAPFGGFGHFSAGFNGGYYLKNLIWFAFPAWPLALWTASRLRLYRQDWGRLCLVWLAVFGLLLTLSPQRSENLLMWLLPPLALAAAAQTDQLRRGAAAFLNWFGIMTFGMLAAFIWLGFFAMNFGWPAKLAERAAYFSPYYQTDLDYFPIIVATLFTPLWLLAITRRYVRGRQAVTNWAAGLTLCWSLMLTLFLPWLDAAKSYRPVVQRLEAALPGAGCISATESNIRLAWPQYAHSEMGGENCPYLITLRQQTAPPGWQPLAESGRPRQRDEVFVLWQRPSTPD